METQLLFEMSATLKEPLVISDTPEGERVIIYITGGTFEGPQLRGEILPGGGDWLMVRPDGVATLDVRIVLKTDDGELIYMTYRGFAKSSRPEALPDWIRIALAFQVSTKGRYAWLNAVQAVGEGAATDDTVHYTVYEVK